MTPLQILSMQTQMMQLCGDTQTVMTLRVMGMAGILPAEEDENERMVSEKLPALMKSATAAQNAVLNGCSPDQILNAAIAPLSSKVRDNRIRLTQ